MVGAVLPDRHPGARRHQRQAVGRLLAGHPVALHRRHHAPAARYRSQRLVAAAVLLAGDWLVGDAVLAGPAQRKLQPVLIL